MNAIAIIPARGGSKRIPGKNIRPFHGKSIIAYSIEAARASDLFDRIVVSTDNRQIRLVAARYGAEVFMRDADDGARGTQEVATEVLRALPATELACCIYPTAPLIWVGHLRTAEALVRNGRSAYCYSVHGWRDAGQFYFGASEAFLEGVPLDHWSTYRIDVGAHRFCDINIEADWQRAEQMYLQLTTKEP